jgi:hypothetical protein
MTHFGNFYETINPASPTNEKNDRWGFGTKKSITREQGIPLGIFPNKFEARGKIPPGETLWERLMA